jgi:hypothetical protein
MIIVDTSIWIEFFKGNIKIFNELKALLEKGNVLGVEWIFGELLQGARDKREINIINEYWKNLPKSENFGIWIEAGILSSENKLFSKGVGLIDASLIILSIKYSAKIWSLDKKLNSILKKNQKY